MTPTVAPSPVAVRLGILAVAPFLAGAILAWPPDTRPYALPALSAYAAVVISFIGAIHWGLAFPQSRPANSLFVWGVAPSIVAWVASLMPSPVALVTHAAMLVACYLVDRRVYVREQVAAWLPLRLRLTVAATLCCLVAAAAR